MITILEGDAMRQQLATLTSESVQCCVTSPPYWGLRDYGVDGQLGLEATPEAFVDNMVALFREVRRVLRNDGTLWLNLGDSYAKNGVSGLGVKGESSTLGGAENSAYAAISKTVPYGLKPKDLVGIPWRVAFALQADGWYLRSEIIWHKPNPMPESVTDRPTKSHEYIFLLTKSERYFYDADAIREESITADPRRPYAPGQVDHRGNGHDRGGGKTRKAAPLIGSHGTNGHDGNGMRMPEKWNDPRGRNKRSVWTVAMQPYSEAHFATFPEELPKLCILAGSRVGDTVLDPFAGSGTTGMVATELGRESIMIELNPKYCELIRDRTNVTKGML